MSTRDAILNFRREHAARYGTENPSTPSGIGQILDLQETRLLAIAMLLEVEPEVLLRIVDQLVWDSDLSDLEFATARNDLGFGNTVWLTSEDMSIFLETIKAPPPLAPALKKAIERRALLSLLALGEKELDLGEVRPASEVFREVWRSSRAPTVAEEAEAMEEINIEVSEVRRHRGKRTPAEQAELNTAIKKVVEALPPRLAEDFDAIRVALEAKWKK